MAQQIFHKIRGRTFQVWYDRGARMWAIIELDSKGSQINDAQYAASRDMALIYVGLDAAAS